MTVLAKADLTTRARRHAACRRVGAAAAMLAVALTVGVPVAAAAQTRVRRFHLPAERLEDALVRFAIQADVSIGGAPPGRCGARSRPVDGTFTPAEALARLLPAERCGFEAVDTHTFRILERRNAAPPTPAVTQPAPPQPAPRPPMSVAELVVTAERRTEALSHTPYAVSVLSGDEVRRLGAKSFDEVASQMVGVTVTNLGSGRNKIFIRGLSDGSFTGKTQSTVGLYLDDVPITYNAPDPDLRLVDVERVEVLRGPQGSLYGSGSIGGIVRIVTRRPVLHDYEAYLGAEGAVTASGAPSSGLQATLNLPLIRDRVALRAVIYRDERGGYIDNTRLMLEDVNYSRRVGARLSVLVDLTPDWQLQGGFTHQSINTADSQYHQGPDGPLTRNTVVREPHDNDFIEGFVTATYAGRLADVKVSTAYVDHATESRFDATGAFAVPGGRKRRVAFDEMANAKLFVNEVTVTSAQPGRLHWLGGLFASQAMERDTSDLSAAIGGRLFSVAERKDKLTELAAYGEVSYALRPKILVTVGGRLFATRLTMRSQVFNPETGPAGRFEGQLTDQGVAPKFRISYEPAPDVLIYAQAQRGYRAGGFNNPAVRKLGTRDPAVLKDVPRFQPDRLTSYEVGASAPLFNRALMLRAAVFHADWTGLQSDQYLSSGLPLTVNIGDGSNTGVEFEGLWRPNERLQVRGTLMVADSQLIRARDAFPARPDIGLPGVPSLLGSTDVKYAWPIGPDLRAEVSGQVSYVGHSFLTFDAGPATGMGGYAVGRLTAQLSSRKWTVETYLDNITDETGNTFAFGNPFSRARASQTTPLRPRTFGLGVAMSF